MADIKSINALNNNQSNNSTVVGDESDILGMELHPNARDRSKNMLIISPDYYLFRQRP